MTERDGLYALVGWPTPKRSSPSSSSSVVDNEMMMIMMTATPLIVKEMRYAIVLLDDLVRVYLIRNTCAANEILGEEIRRCNGRVIRTAESFDLTRAATTAHNTNAQMPTTSFLSIELTVNYNSSLVNSDSTIRRINLNDVWTSSSDFIAIELPFASLAATTTTTSTGANTCAPAACDFDLKVRLECDRRLLFSYTNINTAIGSQLQQQQQQQQQQEFYSSVSAMPLFIPLK